MKSLIHFLKEDSNYTPGMYEEAEEYIRHMHEELWRGFGSEFSVKTFGVIHFNGYPESYTRESTSKLNLISFYVSEISEAFKYFPKRTKSIFCSTSKDEALNYAYSPQPYYVHKGNYQYVFLVIPKNEHELLAVCPTSDFWSAFPDINGIYSFETFFYHMFNDLDIPFSKVKTKEDFYHLVEIINEVTRNLESKYKDTLLQSKNAMYWESLLNDYEYFSYYHKKINGDLMGYLKRAVDAEAHKFELVTYSRFKATRPSQEVWFQGPAICIKHELYEKLSK